MIPKPRPTPIQVGQTSDGQPNSSFISILLFSLLSF
uniref:Uncharacterized protein n=1 Tax=Arundo donax TaxID=35708 RepID=A0A0A8YXI5_ARUDO